jgi:hypothetical protein
MPCGVARGGDDLDARQWVCVALDGLEGRLREVEDVRVDGVPARLGQLQLGLLDEDRRPREALVPAAMVEVQVAVRDGHDLVRAYALAR